MGIRSSHRRQSCDSGVRKGISAAIRRGDLSAMVRFAAIATIMLAAFTGRAWAAMPAPMEPLISTLLQQAPGLRSDVLRLAMNAAMRAEQDGLLKRSDLLTVIDYSIPSTEPRLFVFDLAAQKLLFRELVAHGKNSGDLRTTRFSNDEGSLASSIGLYVTANPYVGSNGYSLRLRGLDEGFNDHAWERAIVMHGAPYVNDATARALGRLGRSWGCPAVRKEIARRMIDTLKGGSAIFAYYPDSNWLQSSRFLH